MSTKRNRKARRNRGRRMPGSLSRSERVPPGPPPPATSAPSTAASPLVRRGIGAPPATSTPWASGRRLSASTAALVGVVALEVAALGVLAYHVASRTDEAVTVSSTSYAAPVRLPAGTAYVRSRVVAPGTLMVSHWIH